MITCLGPLYPVLHQQPSTFRTEHNKFIKHFSSLPLLVFFHKQQFQWKTRKDKNLCGELIMIVFIRIIFKHGFYAILARQCTTHLQHHLLTCLSVAYLISLHTGLKLLIKQIPLWFQKISVV